VHGAHYRPIDSTNVEIPPLAPKPADTTGGDRTRTPK